MDTIIESNYVDLRSYCSTFAFQRQNRHRPNHIDVDYMPTLELCVRMTNFDALKHILQRVTLQSGWIIHALKSDSDKAYELVSQYINPEALGRCNS